MVNLSDDLNGLAGLNDDGSAPATRVKDADSARTILSECISADSLSSYRRAQIQGIIDGNTPFTDEELRDAGRSDQINVNWGRHMGKKQSNGKTGIAKLLQIFTGSFLVKTKDHF